MSNNITINNGLRMIKLIHAKKNWKNSNEADIWSDIWSTRTCFDSACSEWNATTIDEKIAILKELINNKGFDTLQLSISMMEVGNTRYGKDIKEIDLVSSMSTIIDHLLKTKDAVEKEVNFENEDVMTDIWYTRGYFQTTCSEWDSTTIDEKIEALKELLNKQGFNTFALSLSIMDMGNTKFNKDITPLDLVLSMSLIIDQLLK